MGRDTTESHRRIELSWLRKKGYFPSGGNFIRGNIQWSQYGEPTSNINITVDTSSSSPSILFDYKSKNYWESENEWRQMNYSFRLEKLPCRYGGHKWFVRCGLSSGGIYCGRRVRILYNVNGYYGCRHCANLSYESCNESGRFRGGVFGFLSKQWKAEELLDSIPRKFYRGKPTRKYRRYLKMASNYDPEEVDRALSEIRHMLDGKATKIR